MIVRSAINEMKGQGAEVIEVTIPGVNEHMTDTTVQRSDFKFDLDVYFGFTSKRAGANARRKTCLPENIIKL